MSDTEWSVVPNRPCSPYAVHWFGSTAVITTVSDPTYGWSNIPTCHVNTTSNATAQADGKNWFTCTNQFGSVDDSAQCSIMAPLDPSHIPVPNPNPEPSFTLLYSVVQTSAIPTSPATPSSSAVPVPSGTPTSSGGARAIEKKGHSKLVISLALMGLVVQTVW
ncbi:hypothetical protein BU15DRAFT_68013 [Melanogaster broomeanus]|nr:hypothetical protein BU15DRAFT_68013 [Melanogaster broomeanus]